MSFYELRMLLTQKPSQPLFRNILNLFETWKEENTSIAIDYCNQHMKTWDSSFRHWSGTNFQKLPKAWALIRSISCSLYLKHLPASFLDKKRGQHIEFLVLHCENLQTLKGLDSFSNIKSLSLLGCSSLQSVKYLPQSLTDLLLTGCDLLETMDGIENPNHLEKLSIVYAYSLQNIEALSRCSRLIQFKINNCPSLQNMDALSHCSRLISLEISSCPTLQDLSFLNHLTSLTELNLREMNSFPDINRLLRLKHLTLQHFESLQNLDGLSHCTQLSRLNIQSCYSLQNVFALGNLAHLTELYLTRASSLEVMPTKDEMSSREEVLAYQKRIQSYYSDNKKKNDGR